MPTGRLDRPSLLVAVGLIFVVIAALVTVWLHRNQQTADQWVRHTLEVETQLSRLQRRLAESESYVRGYILSGNAAFLKDYEAAVADVPRSMGALDTLTQDNPAQRRFYAELRPLVMHRLAGLKQGVADQQHGVEFTPARFADGRQRSARTRVLIERMMAEETRLLFERRTESDRLSRLVSTGLFASAALIIILGVITRITMRIRLKEAEAARDSLDIANRRLIEEAERTASAEGMVRQMQKMESVGQLAGGIAHDFNNMLAIVLGSLDLVRRRLGADVDPRVQRGIDNASEGAERAAQLTRRLLAFSRQQPLEPQAVDANKLVAGMSELLRRTIGEAVRVETVLSGGLWRTRIDPAQLESAILNLCVNARDAILSTGRTGQLTIDTANAHLDDAYAEAHNEVVAGQYVMVSVTDSGVGMAPDVIDRVFEPFYTTKEVGRGTGLGLSQVYGFVKQSGGHVKIYSEVGQGTTVKLYLPRHYGEDAVAAPAVHLADADLPRARGDELILVVEDEEQVRRTSVESLLELGYRVLEAADAERALVHLAGPQSEDIALLFTDVVMPGMNGRQLADRARINLPHLRILYTTGYTRNAIVHNGMLDPGVQFLAKPFTLEQLALKIRQSLDAEMGTADAT